MIDSRVMIGTCFCDSTRKWRANISLIRENLHSHRNIYHAFGSSSLDEFFYTCTKINMIVPCNESIKVLSNHVSYMLFDSHRADQQRIYSQHHMLIGIVSSLMTLYYQVIILFGLVVIFLFWVVVIKRRRPIHLRYVGSIHALQRTKKQIFFWRCV